VPNLLPQGIQVPNLLPQGIQVPNLLPQGAQVPNLLPQGAQVQNLLPQGLATIGQTPRETPPSRTLETIPAAAQAATLGQLQALPGVTIVGLQLTPKQTLGVLESPTPADTFLRAPEVSPVALASALALAAYVGVDSVQAAEAPLPIAAAETSPPMLDALRVQLGIPGEAITRRLAQMSGSKASMSWAELVSKAVTKAGAGSLAGAAVPMSTVSSAGAGPDAALALAPLPTVPSANSPAGANAAALDLAIGLAAPKSGEPAADDPLQAKPLATPQLPARADDAASPELAEEIWTVEVPAGLDLGALTDHVSAPVAEPGGLRQGHAPAAALMPQNAADAARAALHERAEQTQVLADRMGQALANRLIGQIERGQWKLQMRLQPEALGRVEVALDMHAGGLDAVFRTDNALTQDLLGQGAQRLRDALSQSGTTVASVTVHADARGQSGGNSTPQKRQPAPKQSAAPAAVGAVPHKAARYTGGVAEGLNVLA
jgi:flagellar hook-length control protein FliK